MTTGIDAATRSEQLARVLRERLEQERAELLGQLQLVTVEQPQATATTGQGETEHIASEVELRVQAVLDAAAAARLVHVDAALRRFDDGTYGRCERCAAAIAPARLEALPHVPLCLMCQSDEDARRRLRHPR